MGDVIAAFSKRTRQTYSVYPLSLETGGPFREVGSCRLSHSPADSYRFHLSPSICWIV
jgi:hypothetical protein